VRLRLLCLNLYDKGATKVITEEKYSTQHEPNFETCLKKFLAKIDEGHKPSIAVVGIAGSVHRNQVVTTNATHWGTTDGDKIAQEVGLESLTIINDFEAVGYGATNVKESDLICVQEGEY
jgi:glucokinase